jgi:hypothetical protein
MKPQEALDAIIDAALHYRPKSKIKKPRKRKTKKKRKKNEKRESKI